MIPNLQPTKSRVIVEPMPEPELPSGIVLPASANSMQRGRIVAIGPGEFVPLNSHSSTMMRQPTEYCEGQIVMYAAFSGTELYDCGKKYVLLGADDILATVR